MVRTPIIMPRQAWAQKPFPPAIRPPARPAAQPSNQAGPRAQSPAPAPSASAPRAAPWQAILHRVRLLSPKEFQEASAARMALGKQRDGDPEWLRANNSTYGWARLDEITGPCVMWQGSWYFDPADPEDAPRRDHAMAALRDGTFSARNSWQLSRFYWQRWSSVRPPLTVLCPNGREWCIDAVSSNGEGWTVEGEAPLVTVSPSIDVEGYHGFLGSSGAPPGYFTGDLNGRGPNGAPR